MTTMATGAGSLGRIAQHLGRAALLLVLLAAPAAAQNVALVTDVSGPVAGREPVAVLSELRSGSQLELAAGAKLVAIHLATGDEYSFSGPARIQFEPDGPRVLSGAPPQRRASPLRAGALAAVRPAAVAQAAYVMRSARPTARIRLLTLNGTKTLDASPEFRWQGLEAVSRYRFELTDETGKSLYDVESESASLRLPPSVQLREGVGYTWEISARGTDGRRYVSAGDFSLASSDLRAQAERLRPAPGAPFSERVAYALWLEQMELKDEARKYWRALAAERPDDSKLKALAAE
ncbi:MAG TPA: hypothetical protein VNK67_13725 [Burkholderiales bacterium]|nr:hypothetical protein [Burkholderiales bacterium]